MIFSRGNRFAFTLLELSVVLVAIGLIASGILVTQNLIRNFQLRSAMTQLNQYESAMQQFKGQYNSLPGDMPNATSYWGYDSTVCTPPPPDPLDPNPYILSPGAPGTCDGDGDGRIAYREQNPNRYPEHFRAWQQLNLAGFLETPLTGLLITANPARSIVNAGFAGTNPSLTTPYSQLECTGGTNCPQLTIDDASVMLWYMDFNVFSTGAPFFSNWRRGEVLIAGLEKRQLNMNGFLTVEEIYSLDKKYDDTSPSRGKVTTSTNCATSTVPTSAAYAASTSTQTCVLEFWPKLH